MTPHQYRILFPLAAMWGFLTASAGYHPYDSLPDFIVVTAPAWFYIIHKLTEVKP